MSGGANYSSIATVEAVPVETMVEVAAPANLQGGYTFQAIYNGVTFPVTVPSKGVMQGQKMTVPFPGQPSELTPFVDSSNEAPMGQWKDGICDCCKFSVLHPAFLNACCCPQILMAQVLTRMKMDWLGSKAPMDQWKATFRIIILIVIIYFFLSMLLAPPAPTFEVDEDASYGADVDDDKVKAAMSTIPVLVVVPPDIPQWQTITYNVLSTIFGVYSFIVLWRLRKAVRERYQIPERICKGCEDICCVFWCGCCTVAQLARQTANYDERRAVCCTDNGLPPPPSSYPAIVV